MRGKASNPGAATAHARSGPREPATVSRNHDVRHPRVSPSGGNQDTGRRCRRPGTAGRLAEDVEQGGAGEYGCDLRRRDSRARRGARLSVRLAADRVRRVLRRRDRGRRDGVAARAHGAACRAVSAARRTRERRDRARRGAARGAALQPAVAASGRRVRRRLRRGPRRRARLSGRAPRRIRRQVLRAGVPPRRTARAVSAAKSTIASTFPRPAHCRTADAPARSPATRATRVACSSATCA